MIATGNSGNPLAVDAGRMLYKFGLNASVSTTFETVWTGGGLYPWPAAAATSRVRSTNAADTMDVIIYGLLDDFSPVAITATLNGTSYVTLPLNLYRCFRIRIKGAVTPTGDIQAEINAVKVAEILTGRNTTEMTVFTVPKGTNMWMPGFRGSNDGNKGGNFEVWARSPGGVMYNDGHLYVPAEKGSDYVNFEPYKLYGPGKDIEIRGSATSVGQVSASFGGIFSSLVLFRPVS